MSDDALRTGVVIRYPYLWARQAQAGETEGRKDRPVAVGVRLPRANGDLVLFFPVTSETTRNIPVCGGNSADRKAPRRS